MRRLLAWDPDQLISRGMVGQGRRRAQALPSPALVPQQHSGYLLLGKG